MPFLPEFLASLGLGSQVVVAASLAMVALYVYRAVGIARLIAGIAGLIATHALVLLVAFAAVIALGWVAPNADTMTAHARIAWDIASDRGIDLLRFAFEYISRLGR